MPGVKSQDRRLKQFERVLAALQSGEPFRYQVIRERLGVTSQAATGAVATAKRKGLIKNVDRGIYIITEKGKEHLESRLTKEAQWEKE